MAIATRLSPKAMTTLGVMAFATLCFQTFNSSALSSIDATILARLEVIERQMATLRATMNHVLKETDAEAPANITWPDQPSSDEGLEAAQLQLQVCNSTCGDRRFRDRAWPLTLFSPGLGASRQLYNALAEQLAAMGYIVVTIDTPLQASIVEYTDGSFVLGSGLITNPQPQVALPDRVKDIVLVKNKLLTGVGLPSSVKPDATRIAAWGHSFGGAAAAQVSLEDPSFKAGINFDGTLFGSVATSGLKQPFLIFSHAGQLLNETISSWDSFLQASPKFDKLELRLNGSVHNTFSDAPLLADLAGIADLPGVDAALGQLNGRRVLVILAAYTDAFFKFAFHGAAKLPELLRGPSAGFPEVEFVVDLP
ncbi:alpha/beta-hydrolase, partial [Aureobasidium melanogenum]